MAIKLGDMVSHLKRTARYGQTTVTNDPPTQDILTSINKRLSAIWGRHNWKWSREKLSFDLVAGVRQYDVTALSGNPIDRIEDLIPFDATGTFLAGKPLTQRTTRGFFERHGNDFGYPVTVEQPNRGERGEYYQVELTADNVRTIVLWPTPDAASKMGGYAKGVLTSYTIADIVANVAIAYFPNDTVLDALFAGVMIDLGLIQGTTTPESAAGLERVFSAKISQLVSDQAGVATDNTPITTKLPAIVARMMSRRNRSRR